MKTHEHAAISLGYTALLALMANKSLTDPWLYLYGLIGGELIDFIDHPLYHLVYNRKNKYVIQTRQILKEKGLKAALAYLKQIENKRKFKGLWLHNVGSLFIIACFALIISLFFDISIYFLIAVNTFFLHMLTDIYADFKLLGHFDNWLWVLPKNIPSYFSKTRHGLLCLAIIFCFFIEVSFLILTIRTYLQLSQPANHRYWFSIFYSNDFLTCVPFIILASYYFFVFLLGMAAYHKYRLEVDFNPNYTAGFNFFQKIRFKEVNLNKEFFNNILLKLQAHQEVGILICALLIALVLNFLTILRLDTDFAIVLIPIFLALFFGTFIHTTVGECGSVLGILLAWMLNFILARGGMIPLWSMDRCSLFFSAAIGAWILGLLGGIILRQKSRMSLGVFIVKVSNINKNRDDNWIKELLHIAQNSLNEGFRKAHEQLFVYPPKKNYTAFALPKSVATPYQSNPVYVEKYCHLYAKDTYVPAIRELEYVLCDNAFSSYCPHKTPFYPIMPRYRTFGDPSIGDMIWINKAYYWKSKKKKLILPSSGSVPQIDFNGKTWLLFKPRNEIWDNLFTKSSTIHMDLIIFGDKNNHNEIILCGMASEQTSTKEYATVEAEAYAIWVLNILKQKIDKHPAFNTVSNFYTRIFYPRISFYDMNLWEKIKANTVLSSDMAGFPITALSNFKQALFLLPDKNYISSVSANIGRKIMVLGIEYVIAVLADPQIRHFLKSLFKKLGT